MEPITRRQVLRLGAVGSLSVVVGATGLSRTGLPWRQPGAVLTGATGASGALAEPEELSSERGLLRVELVAAEAEVEIAGRRTRVLCYNGQVPGQTWRVRPGDRIEVRLVNRLSAPTNLHTHGLYVSPVGNSDNALLSIEPGETFDYRFDLPEDHPTGVFWYHPHRHGYVADQIFGGMYGTILVVGDDDFPVVRERVLVLSDISLTADGSVRRVGQMQRMAGREGELVLVNGQHRPEISTTPGQRERWRVVNACTSRYMRLAVPGQQVQLLGIDSGHEAAPREVDEVFLAPGNRADLLVTMREGSTELRSLGYDRGAPMMGMMGGTSSLSGPISLATVRVAGAAAVEPEKVPRRSADADLRGREPDSRRDISFTMGMGPGMSGDGMAGMMSLGFDGRVFDAERTDQRIRPGALEEWTIRNPTPMDHPFHLHVWPMQLVEENGAAIPAVAWRDVVNVPAQGQVVIRVDFSRFTGRTVYHCHILDHEDAGMMGIAAVASD
uniref:Multicopper oxidase n=1 Tax=uncultured Microbacterium sp. TaxID=191216 RepID=A0A3Q8UEY0_9MICO|nr:multicopper oxidase [uncultured Microbacterium sp.]